MNVRLTAGGAVATHCHDRVNMDWNEVSKEKRKEKKQSEMILPSVLSEASSLVANREREDGGEK